MSNDPVEKVLRSFREELARGVSSRAEFERLKGAYLGREKGLVPQIHRVSSADVEEGVVISQSPTEGTKVDKQTLINIKGADKRLVGQVAANLRAIKPPDVYKQKGIRYSGEVLRKKEGKTGK